MNDLEEIRRVIALYGPLLDDGRFDEWGLLFTADAEWISVPGINQSNGSGSQTVTTRGRDNIVAQNKRVAESTRQAKARLLHFSSQPVVDIQGDRADAWWDFILMRAQQDATSATHTGRYYARLSKQDGRWRFAQRVSVQSGGAMPPGLPPLPVA